MSRPFFLIGICQIFAINVAAENPLRKIVTLLQNMAAESETEGARAQELFDKFSCYCQTNEAQLAKSIESAQSRTGELTSGIEELSGSNAQIAQEIKDLKDDLASSTKSISEATAQRTKEASAYAEESTESKNTIGALDQAIPKLKAGLESPAAVLAQLGSTVSQGPPQQASLLQNFMHGQEGLMGADQILGILEQMRDNFKMNLRTAIQEEEEAIESFVALTDAKKKEVAAATRGINEKTGRKAIQTQQLADYKEELEDITASLAADSKFSINLKKTCAQKTAEHEASTEARNEEKIAISEAIKILNDDESLELMKKTLPGSSSAASFIQAGMVRRHETLPQRKALSFLAVKMETYQPQIDLGPLKRSVEGVIEGMKEGQADDDAKLKVCKTSLDETAKELSGLSSSEASLQSKLATLKDQVALVQEEMQATKAGIAELEASLAQAKEQRKKESAESIQVLTQCTLSLDLINKAKGVLQKVFAKKASLIQTSGASSFEDSLASFLHETQPETAEFKSQGAAGMSVIGMLDTISADIKAEQSAAKKEEDDAQADFEEAVADMQKSSQVKKKDVLGKEAEASRVRETLLDLKENLSEVQDEKAAAQSKEHALHADCDFLVQNYEERKKARTNEIEAVTRSLSILSGADFGA
jgi:chromosome segregation ATPase